MMLEVKDLSVRYGPIVAVDKLNLEVEKGQMVALIGTNGAGKSTFLRMASGVLKPDEGTIQLDGEDIYENLKMKRLSLIHI